MASSLEEFKSTKRELKSKLKEMDGLLESINESHEFSKFDNEFYLISFILLNRKTIRINR
jgi:hypothetical protein